MKQNTYNRTARPSPLSRPQDDDFLYFRLCHFCLHLNESAGEILDCDRCHKHLTLEPLLRTVLEDKAAHTSEEAKWEDEEDPITEEEEEQWDRFVSAQTNFRKNNYGLTGLSVLW